ncbi:hypothetical protein SAMN02949497_4239 [Methylomagnum ishizawai]|uniref:Uncharacterized protein n=1 Tax=Methylomagnum ishizawai TaxID=1760988 RepID=A0A1Y6D1M1_9GAMM|nr:hypothetical protein [Methylomagnum ishizawai]SMF96828.1 hypothetical protein SAMN02949497_4239 [Methylomagnum ishizawai]
MDIETLIALILADIAADAALNIEEPIRTPAEAWAVIQERLDIFWAAVKNPQPGPTPYRHLVGVGVACVESALGLYGWGELPDAAQTALSQVTSRFAPKVATLHDGYGRLVAMQTDLQGRVGLSMLGGDKEAFRTGLRALLACVFVIAADLDLRAEEFPATGDGETVAQAA